MHAQIGNYGLIVAKLQGDLTITRTNSGFEIDLVEPGSGIVGCDVISMTVGKPTPHVAVKLDGKSITLKESINQALPHVKYVLEVVRKQVDPINSEPIVVLDYLITVLKAVFYNWNS